MKAVVIREFGDRSKMIFTDVAQPMTLEGEVLIKIKASGVNPVDCKIREGLLKNAFQHKFPLILGWEMSGIIEEVGYGARRFQKGDEVYAYTRRPLIQNGTYAEYIVIPQSYVTLKPKNLSFEEAACVPLAGLTAYQSLYEKAKVKDGDSVLILGASGGVGSFAVQLAKLTGAKVTGVASFKNEGYINTLGADNFVDYVKDNWTESALKLEPEKYDVVFDCVGGETLLKAHELVKKGGKLISIAGQGFKKLLDHNGIHFTYVFVEPNTIQLDHLRMLFEDNKLQVKVSQTYKLEEASKAHLQAETGHTRGKIVLKIE